MATLKCNLHSRHPVKKTDYQEITQFTFEKTLANTQKNSIQQDHRSLIDEIRSKNTLLTNVQNQKKHTTTKTLPTKCEKYVNILYKKYGLKAQTKFQQPKSKPIPATFLSKEQQIHRSIFLAQQFLQTTQQDFEYSIGQLLLRLKQISNNLSSKNTMLRENYKSIEDELVILEFFINKLTNKATKPQVSPFFLFTKEIKSQTLDQKNYQSKTSQNLKSQHSVNTKLDKKGLDLNLQGDKSPHLLSAFEVKQHEQSYLYMNCKPHLETLENCDDMTDKIDIYFNEEDQFINSVTEGIVSDLKTSTQNQFKTIGSVMSIYSQSVDQFSKIIQSTHLTISEQKLLIQGEWNEISLFLTKDIQEMLDLLELERSQNQIKDKKFLENLDTIQNQLIEEIFAQKESRKADEKLLTQVLANLAESIQRDL